jgi:hypothetical protein
MGRYPRLLMLGVLGYMPNDATSAFESRVCVSANGCLEIDEKAFVPGTVSVGSYRFDYRLETLFEKPAADSMRH